MRKTYGSEAICESTGSDSVVLGWITPSTKTGGRIVVPDAAGVEVGRIYISFRFISHRFALTWHGKRRTFRPVPVRSGAGISTLLSKSKIEGKHVETMEDEEESRQVNFAG
jgi:hypothetical protein